MTPIDGNMLMPEAGDAGAGAPQAMPAAASSPSPSPRGNVGVDGAPMAGAPGAAPAQSEDALSSAYTKLKEARGRMDAIQDALGKLVDMGDSVTEEDVVKSAGKIVAAGVAPEGMAALLADMPQKPELLAEWLGQHKMEIDQKEAQLDDATDTVRHELGAQALRELMGHHEAQQMAAQATPPVTQVPGAAPQNSLMPGGA